MKEGLMDYEINNHVHESKQNFLYRNYNTINLGGSEKDRTEY